jgi:hypothetical protein
VEPSEVMTPVPVSDHPVAEGEHDCEPLVAATGSLDKTSPVQSRDTSCSAQRGPNDAQPRRTRQLICDRIKRGCSSDLYGPGHHAGIEIALLATRFNFLAVCALLLPSAQCPRNVPATVPLVGICRAILFLPAFSVVPTPRGSHVNPLDDVASTVCTLLTSLKFRHIEQSDVFCQEL